MKEIIQKWLGITDTKDDINKLRDRKCLTVEMFDRLKILESIKELEKRINIDVYDDIVIESNIVSAIKRKLNDRIDKLEDKIKEL